jgi:uncharacterized membrane protein
MIQGLLLLAPVVITIYIVITLFSTFDDFANDIVEILFGRRVVGLGFLMLIAFITLIGYISSLLIVKPLFAAFEKLIMKTPGIKIVYSGLKDLMSALTSGKKKFNRPVLININHNPLIQRMGFITQHDMKEFGLKNKVAVYIPHSYNFSGNLYIVDAREIVPLENVSSTEALKFMVSGGIAEMDD